MREILFLSSAGVFMTALLGVATYFILRARRISRDAWSSILGRLRRVDRDKLMTVALDLLDEDGPVGSGMERRQLDPESIFEMIGGMGGLSALEENCDVLVDLAAYVQRWYPEALLLAEDLRLNAREIKWHIGRLRGAAQTGHLREHFPMYAQRAAATYYLMTRSLLVLYEGVHLPEYAELQHAI